MLKLNEAEKILKALSNSRRLQILIYLRTMRQAIVTDIANEIKLSIRSTSKHLVVLRAAGLVEREQISIEVWYRSTIKRNSLAGQVLTML